MSASRNQPSVMRAPSKLGECSRVPVKSTSSTRRPEKSGGLLSFMSVSRSYSAEAQRIPSPDSALRAGHGRGHRAFPLRRTSILLLSAGSEVHGAYDRKDSISSREMAH